MNQRQKSVAFFQRNKKCKETFPSKIKMSNLQFDMDSDNSGMSYTSVIYISSDSEDSVDDYWDSRGRTIRSTSRNPSVKPDAHSWEMWSLCQGVPGTARKRSE